MFRSKKAKEPKVEEKKGGRFTLKRSKSKKKHGLVEHPGDASDPPVTHVSHGALPAANPSRGQSTPMMGNSAEYGLVPQQGVQARALYEYDPEQEDEIQLKEGDIVIVYERDESGWWTGECRGKYGLFPGAFVELLNGPGAAVTFAPPQLAAVAAEAAQYHQQQHQHQQPQLQQPQAVVQVDAPAHDAVGYDLRAQLQQSGGETASMPRSQPGSLPASSSTVSVRGSDAMADSAEILSYLEEGLHGENGAPADTVDEADDLAGDEHYEATDQEEVHPEEAGVEGEAEGGAAEEGEEQHEQAVVADGGQQHHQGPEGEPAAAATEYPTDDARSTPAAVVINSSSKVHTRSGLMGSTENGHTESVHAQDNTQHHQQEQQQHQQQHSGQVDPAVYQAWEQERAEWEQHSHEWELSYQSLNAEFEAVKHEREEILQQLEELRGVHDQDRASAQTLSEELERQKQAAQAEKETADQLLTRVQRLEEQLQEAEREKVQAQASTLSAEANAQEISRLHSLLSEESKSRESAEKALDEERRRVAAVEEELVRERDLRAEAEKKLEQAQRDVHQRVARVEETLLRHLQEARAQLAAAISSRPPSRAASANSSPSSSFITGGPGTAQPPTTTAPAAATTSSSAAGPSSAPHLHPPRQQQQHQHQQHQHQQQHQPQQVLGPHAPGGRGGRPFPPAPVVGGRAPPPQPHPRPAMAHPPNGVGGLQTQHGIAPRPGVGPGGTNPAAGGRGRGGPPPMQGPGPSARGPGAPMPRPQIPPGSQKPPLAAQPMGPRTIIPAGGTARAAVSRPPPGRPRGTVPPTAGHHQHQQQQQHQHQPQHQQSNGEAAAQHQQQQPDGDAAVTAP